MGKSLVIVESPAKARTINRYLGRNFVVKASMGHVRDLPKTRLGIDVDEDFTPRYLVIPDKRKIIKELAAVVKKVDTVYLAPDPDREGEAIAWHLVQALKVPQKKIKRVTFNEITKRAVTEAFKDAGELNINRVEAQQARRILDRLVGYLLSPLLWQKISRGLSAGRVQSVATRLIVEREREIEAFVTEEYWKIAAELETKSKERLATQLMRVDGKKAEIKNGEQAESLVARIKGATLLVEKVETKPKTQSAPPPFITSTLQQAASNRLRYSAKRTMRQAQDMYEGVDLGGESFGLITYMRTDSFRVAKEALETVRTLIGDRYGSQFLPEKPNAFRARKGAQEAHEAVRPTDVTRTPDDLEQYVVARARRGQSHGLTKDHLRLYRLIWERFVASQMAPARFELTTVDVNADDCILRAEGKRLVSEGFLKVAGRDPDDKLLAHTDEGDTVTLVEINPTQHFTQPPNRYSEATLVRSLEKKGIGRPSTYAAIISTITDRGYVDLRERKFHATDLGKLVTDQLVAHFGDLVNVDFTSGLEGKLDGVEEGQANWVKVVDEFYQAFSVDLEKAKVEMTDYRHNPEVSDETCDECGEHLVIRRTRRGTFQGCSKYPDCKFTKAMPGEVDEGRVAQLTDFDCPKCAEKLMLRSGRNGKFLGCSKYPDCRYTVPVDEDDKPAPPKVSDEKCEKCGAHMVIKQGRRGGFLACSGYPECKNTKPMGGRKRPEPEETDEKCEKCGSMMMLRHGRWGPFLGCSGFPKCKNIKKVEKPAGEDGAKDDGAKGDKPKEESPK